MTAVTVVDDSTIELTTDGPYAALLNALWNAAFMKPVAEASTRIVALRTGQGDLIANVPPQLVDQIRTRTIRTRRSSYCRRRGFRMASKLRWMRHAAAI